MPQRFIARRFAENPVITPQMMGDPEENINGPSLIRVPEWVANPLGRYYLYFAHHEGAYIRLACADELRGPWRIHDPGALHVYETGWHPDHVASPDVLIDDERRQIRLYFHAPVTPVPKSSDPDYLEKLLHARQESFLAVSDDGLRFRVRREALGPSYFRVWRRGAHYYALSRLASPLFRSADGLTNFVPARCSPFDGDTVFSNIRHVAVRVKDDVLTVFYTRIGDAPESIYCSDIDMTADWEDWRATPPVLVLQPETGYEGIGLPITASTRGTVRHAERALRDPAVYEEGGRLYLLYSVAGERGIAIAELHETE